MANFVSPFVVWRAISRFWHHNWSCGPVVGQLWASCGVFELSDAPGTESVVSRATLGTDGKAPIAPTWSKSPAARTVKRCETGDGMILRIVMDCQKQSKNQPNKNQLKWCIDLHNTDNTHITNFHVIYSVHLGEVENSFERRSTSFASRHVAGKGRSFEPKTW